MYSYTQNTQQIPDPPGSIQTPRSRCCKSKCSFFLDPMSTVVWNRFHPSVHHSIHFQMLIRVVGAAGSDFPLPTTLSIFSRGSQGVSRPAQRHSPPSVSWVFLGASYQRDVPWTPYQGGVQEALWLGAGATPSSSSHCGGAAALPWAPPECRAFHPFSKGEPSHPTEEAHFSRLYLWSCSFGHYQKLVTIGQSRNKDWLLNRELNRSA